MGEGGDAALIRASGEGARAGIDDEAPEAVRAVEGAILRAADGHQPAVGEAGEGREVAGRVLHGEAVELLVGDVRLPHDVGDALAADDRAKRDLGALAGGPAGAGIGIDAEADRLPFQPALCVAEAVCGDGLAGRGIEGEPAPQALAGGQLAGRGLGGEVIVRAVADAGDADGGMDAQHRGGGIIGRRKAGSGGEQGRARSAFQKVPTIHDSAPKAGRSVSV